MDTVYQIGNREFRLDQQKAKAAFAAKTVINGRQSTAFNLLPLRYGWTYYQYREMKDNHWGPMSAEVPMHLDVAQWQANGLSSHDRWLAKMLVGCLLSMQAKGVAEIQQVIRELVTAPELKLVLGREVHQENLRMEAVLFILFSLALNPHECEATFASGTLKANDVAPAAPELLSRQMELRTLANRRLFAREIFRFGMCLKGLRHHSLFAAFLDGDEGKMPGTRRLLHCILRDESSRVEVLRSLFMELTAENPELKSFEFREELTGMMKETVAAEKVFARELLANGGASFSIEQLEGFIDYLGDYRLRSCELTAPGPGKSNPIPGLTRLLHLREKSSARVRQVLRPCVNEDDL